MKISPAKDRINPARNRPDCYLHFQCSNSETKNRHGPWSPLHRKCIDMAPHDLRRPFKRPTFSDQQRRRDASLRRQEENREDARRRARSLLSTVLSFQGEPESSSSQDSELQLPDHEIEVDTQHSPSTDFLDARQASKLRGREARLLFAKQFMLPEWMIDVPDNLSTDWYVFARPAGKRCFVVSSHGTTVSRLRNGSMLHHFPSALPSGARKTSGSMGGSCILDCIFHELDQTYYVIDVICWAGTLTYDCTADFRLFWLNSKLVETGASDAPSTYHRYKFSSIPVYNCDRDGLHTAYSGTTSYVKDGLLFYNKSAHYQTGNTPLVLVWKDENCSQYVIDTDSTGQVPSQQQVVLELLGDGRLATFDDPPVIFGSFNEDIMLETGMQSGTLQRFSIRNEGLSFVDGKLVKADLQYIGKVNRARTFADSYSKVIFQYSVRHSPLKIDHLFASVGPFDECGNVNPDVEMVG